MTSTRVLTILKALITSSTLTRITTPPSRNRHNSEIRQHQLATLVHPPLVLALVLSIPQGTYEPTKQEQIEPELPHPLLLGEQTIPASEAQKRYRRENMRNLDAGDEPEVNPSLPQTRRQHRFPRPCGLLDHGTRCYTGASRDRSILRDHGTRCHTGASRDRNLLRDHGTRCHTGASRDRNILQDHGTRCYSGASRDRNILWDCGTRWNTGASRAGASRDRNILWDCGTRCYTGTTRDGIRNGGTTAKAGGGDGNPTTKTKG